MTAGAQGYFTRLAALIDVIEGPRPPVEVVDATIVRLWREIFDPGGAAPPDIVPPAMLQIWDSAGYAMTDGAYGGLRAEAIGILDQAGFTGSAAVRITRRHDRLVQVGEPLSLAIAIEAVSECKPTRLGPGHYLTWRTDYFDAAGEKVATATLQLLKYRPAGEIGA